MRWMFISSAAIWGTGSDTGSVASRARSELTRSKCKWSWTREKTGKGVDERVLLTKNNLYLSKFTEIGLLKPKLL